MRRSPFAGAAPSPTSHDAAGASEEWLPLLRSGQMRLPGPLEAEGFVDLEDQWQELIESIEGGGFSEADGDDTDATDEHNS